MNNEEIIFKKKTLFWVGILLCFVSPPFPAIIYGILLSTKEKTRREGLIIIAWAIIWTLAILALVLYLSTHGHPLFKIIKR